MEVDLKLYFRCTDIFGFIFLHIFFYLFVLLFFFSFIISMLLMCNCHLHKFNFYKYICGGKLAHRTDHTVLIDCHLGCTQVSSASQTPLSPASRPALVPHPTGGGTESSSACTVHDSYRRVKQYWAAACNITKTGLLCI